MSGKELKALRRKKNLSQQELADILNVNQADISVWENTRRDIRMIFPEYNERLTDYFYGEQQ